ncbi:alpha/beta hydrolase [Aquabacter sp. CN5-332]|uniref:alpha/beta hydrolase n=1 Tax=Aquabacter sp. CN5-332 TaxID=3156608 RepID=UPI0032B57052
MTWLGILARGGAAAAVLALCACGRPEGMLIPVENPPANADKVDMLVATTRAPSETPGVVFNGERGNGLSFANVVVSIPPNRQVGSIQWPTQAPGDPAREFAVTSLSNVQRADVGKWLATTGKRRVLIFVHGFNTRFDGAVFFFAQFVHDMNASLAPVMFSWPSRGSALDYVYDRESTNFSRSDLAYVLRAAASSPKVDEVVVLAHSMGAWLTMEALRQLALEQGRIPAKISNVILASPDLDVDVFRRQVVEMGEKRPDITIFVSRNDRALGLSSFIAGGVTRVGAVDLSQEPYRSQLEAARGITVLDLTALQSGDPLNHGKFANTPEAVQLLGNRMVAGQTISEGEGGGNGAVAAQAVGNTVGAVVAAPILIFSAGMRN